jgi:hypothetical protein
MSFIKNNLTCMVILISAILLIGILLSVKIDNKSLVTNTNKEHFGDETPVVDKRLIELSDKLKLLELKMQGMKDPIEHKIINKKTPDMDYMVNKKPYIPSVRHYYDNNL